MPDLEDLCDQLADRYGDPHFALTVGPVFYTLLEVSTDRQVKRALTITNGEPFRARKVANSLLDLLSEAMASEIAKEAQDGKY